MRVSTPLLGLLAVAAISASAGSAAAQERPPVHDEIRPGEAWEFRNGEWGKDCVFYADHDRDGRIDYRRAAEPCHSFNHVVWLDRDGDGFFDAEDTEGAPVRVPMLVLEPAPAGLADGSPITARRHRGPANAFRYDLAAF